MKKSFVLLAILLLSFLCCTSPGQDRKVLRIRDRQVIPFALMVREISNTNVILPTPRR